MIEYCMGYAFLMNNALVSPSIGYFSMLIHESVSIPMAFLIYWGITMRPFGSIYTGFLGSCWDFIHIPQYSHQWESCLYILSSPEVGENP